MVPTTPKNKNNTNKKTILRSLGSSPHKLSDLLTVYSAGWTNTASLSILLLYPSAFPFHSKNLNRAAVQGHQYGPSGFQDWSILHTAEVINLDRFTAGKEGPSRGRQAAEKMSDDAVFSAPVPFPQDFCGSQSSIKAWFWRAQSASFTSHLRDSCSAHNWKGFFKTFMVRQSISSRRIWMWVSPDVVVLPQTAQQGMLLSLTAHPTEFVTF